MMALATRKDDELLNRAIAAFTAQIANTKPPIPSEVNHLSIPNNPSIPSEEVIVLDSSMVDSPSVESPNHDSSQPLHDSPEPSAENILPQSMTEGIASLPRSYR